MVGQRQKERLRGEHVITKCTAKDIYPVPTGRNVKTVPEVKEAHSLSHPTPPRNTAPFTLTLDHLFPSVKNHGALENGLKETEYATFEPNMRNGDYNVDLRADPLAITLESTHTNLLRACFYNANSLRISMQGFSTLRCMSLCSPFYRPHTSMSDAFSALLAAVSAPSIPAHLQPTLPQILFPHHPLLDLLPFPELRAKFITLAATAPQILNSVGLKQDIFEKGGLICRHRVGAGVGVQPWDRRSWEMAPWFYRKWKLLITNQISLPI